MTFSNLVLRWALEYTPRALASSGIESRRTEMRPSSLPAANTAATRSPVKSKRGVTDPIPLRGPRSPSPNRNAPPPSGSQTPHVVRTTCPPKSPTHLPSGTRCSLPTAAFRAATAIQRFCLALAATSVPARASKADSIPFNWLKASRTKSGGEMSYVDLSESW